MDKFFPMLEVYHKLLNKSLKSKTDCLVAAIHCFMVGKGNKCVGSGEDWPHVLPRASELLPGDWNVNAEVYTLRYLSSAGYRTLLKMVVSDSKLLVNFYDANQDKVRVCTVDINDYVTEHYQDYAKAYKNLEVAARKIETEVLQVTIPDKASDEMEKPKEHDPSSTPDDNSPVPFNSDFGSGQIRVDPTSDPIPTPIAPSVGRGDLTPFGGSGGMILDPTNPFGRVPERPDLDYGLPTGSVPPGARFDPTSPPILGRGRGGPGTGFPDPDDPSPPGYDGMFM